MNDRSKSSGPMASVRRKCFRNISTFLDESFFFSSSKPNPKSFPCFFFACTVHVSIVRIYQFHIDVFVDASTNIKYCDSHTIYSVFEAGLCFSVSLLLVLLLVEAV